MKEREREREREREPDEIFSKYEETVRRTFKAVTMHCSETSRQSITSQFSLDFSSTTNTEDEK